MIPADFLINENGIIQTDYAVGDMANREDEPLMKQVYTAQEYAVRAVDTIDHRRRKKMREIG